MTAFGAGARVIGSYPESGITYLELPVRVSQPELRRAAEAFCEQRKPCSVFGWTAASLAPKGAKLDSRAERSLAFRFDASDAQRRVPGVIEALH